MATPTEPVELSTSEPSPNTSASAPTAPKNLKGLVVTGAMWTAVAFVVSQGLRFGGNVVLTHLLSPAAFGLMALIGVVLNGISLFSDVGIGPAVVRSDRGDDPVFLNTAWTMQALRGTGIFLVAAASAWPFAYFYEQPELAYLIPVAALNSLLAGFWSIKFILLERELRVREKYQIDILSQVASLVATIAFALVWPSVWALVFGGLVASTFMLIQGLRLDGIRDRFHWDKEVVRSLVTFGRWIFVSTAFTFMGNHLDRLILARYFTMEMLGIFGIAAALADLPERFFVTLAYKVVLPAISRLLHLPRPELRAKLARASRLPLLGFSAITAVLVAFGDLPILWIYDARYKGAAWIFPILILGTWTKALTFASEPLLIAAGKTSYQAAANAVRLLMNVVAIPLGFMLYGVPGAVVAVAARSTAFYVAISFGLRREGLAMPIRDLGLLLVTIAMIAVLMVARAALGFGTALDLMWLQ